MQNTTPGSGNNLGTLGLNDGGIVIDNFVCNLESMTDDHAERLRNCLQGTAARYIYINPIATVRCNTFKNEFFAEARKAQRRWCKNANKMFGRAAWRHSSPLATYVKSNNKQQEKLNRYLERAIQFTGVLYVDGNWILEHEWPDRQLCR